MATAPDGSAHQTLTVALVVRGGQQALEFYARAFGARETLRVPGPADTIAHAQLRIGDSLFFVSDEILAPSGSYQAPETLGGTSFAFYLQVDDADATFARAVAAGATGLNPVAPQPWGAREGLVRDPFGHLWALASKAHDAAFLNA